MKLFLSGALASGFFFNSNMQSKLRFIELEYMPCDEGSYCVCLFTAIFLASIPVPAT